MPCNSPESTTINRSAGAPAASHQVAGAVMPVLCVGREPLELVLLQIFENRDLRSASIRGVVGHGCHIYTLLKY